MMPITYRSWFVAFWLMVLVVVASVAIQHVSTFGLLAIVVIGAAPLIVMFVLARRPAQTTTEAIRAVLTRRSD